MSIGTPQFEDFSGFTPLSALGPYCADDYFKLPEGEPVELIRGRLIESPCPTPLHQVILGSLFQLFDKAAVNSGGLCLLAPMDVVLSDNTILQPDLLYISSTRRNIVTHHVAGPPDLVIEIISPSTGRRDRTEKLSLYAKYGVSEYWIVDPATQVFEFFLLENERYIVEQQPDDCYRSPQLAEIEINLAAFWAEIERRLPKS